MISNNKQYQKLRKHVKVFYQGRSNVDQNASTLIKVGMLIEARILIKTPVVVYISMIVQNFFSIVESWRLFRLLINNLHAHAKWWDGERGWGGGKGRGGGWKKLPISWIILQGKKIWREKKYSSVNFLGNNALIAFLNKISDISEGNFRKNSRPMNYSESFFTLFLLYYSAAYPSWISLLYIPAAYSRCISLLHILVEYPCYISYSYSTIDCHQLPTFELPSYSSLKI